VAESARPSHGLEPRAAVRHHAYGDGPRAAVAVEQHAGGKGARADVQGSRGHGNEGPALGLSGPLDEDAASIWRIGEPARLVRFPGVSGAPPARHGNRVLRGATSAEKSAARERERDDAWDGPNDGPHPQPAKVETNLAERPQRARLPLEGAESEALPSAIANTVKVHGRGDPVERRHDGRATHAVKVLGGT
jgi:hypothetical protein